MRKEPRDPWARVAASVQRRSRAIVLLVFAGLVVLALGGTFATLTLPPLEELVQIGATVAIGVLLDTFVARALLIPAITYRLGERAWWPSRPDQTDPRAGSAQ